MNCFKTMYPMIFLAFIFLSSSRILSQPIPDQLPDDFTPINTEIFNEPPTDEYFFFAFMKAWNHYPDLTPYLVIADNYGTPVFYKKFIQDVMDFKIQPNGLISYYETERNRHIILDSAYREVGLDRCIIRDK